MGIFGRKRIKKINKRSFKPPVDIAKIRPPTQPVKMPILPNISNISNKSMPELHHVKQHKADSNRNEQSAATFAPLFIKLTRYKQILNSMNYIKMSLSLIRNQIAILNELEKLRADNMKILHSTLEKVNDRLVNLDSQFMRPSGFMQDVPEMRMHEVESLENTITDLKVQIEGLKQDVGTLQ